MDGSFSLYSNANPLTNKDISKDISHTRCAQPPYSFALPFRPPCQCGGKLEAVKQESVSNGNDVTFECLNYADMTQNPLRSYAADNVALLRRVAAK